MGKLVADGTNWRTGRQVDVVEEGGAYTVRHANKSGKFQPVNPAIKVAKDVAKDKFYRLISEPGYEPDGSWYED